MPSQYLIALLLVLIVLVVLLVARTSLASQFHRLRRRLFPPPQPPANTGVTIIQSNGEEYAVPPEPAPAASLADRALALGRQRALVLVVVVGLLALLAAWQLYRLAAAPASGQFVVLVAPFHEPGGAVGQTGREVAAALAAALPNDTGGRVAARTIADPPADAAAALDQLSRENADALVWGDIAAGGMLDRATLQPVLTYRPRGPLAALGWDGYAGRFAMPTDYVLASSPINGQAVLRDLLGALADYDAGRLDPAFDGLGRLMSDYSALAPTLPRALRGNILWARGEFQQATGEYQAALLGVSSERGAAQSALLYNNLGAIQHDAGDTAGAAASFEQAIQALQGHDLSVLRYNLGLQALSSGNTADAVVALEIARSPDLLGGANPPAALLLALGEAYRQNAQFEQASAAIAAAERQAAADAAGTTADMRNSVSARLQADAETQRALLALAQSAGARGPLLWELLGNNVRPTRELESARSDLGRAVDDTQVAAQLWTRLSTTKDAAGEPISGQVAINQAQQAQEQLRERQRWQALVELARGSLQSAQKPGGLASVWAALVGDRSPVGRGRSILETLLKSQPGDVDTLVLLGNSALLSGNNDDALAQFNRAAALAPRRPEPAYGQALATLPSDRARAKQQMAQAIANNPAFFPARQRLAVLAEEDREWAAAAEQRRWLAQNRPSLQNTLALAAVLQQIGPGGAAEAEQILLPLANQNNTEAMIALSALYEKQGDADGARQLLERAQQAAPNSSEVAYQYGQLLERQKNPDGALAAYSHAIDLDSGNVPARLALGRLYADRGEPVQAGQQYQVALKAGASDPRELQHVGDVLLANGEYDDAATAYQNAIDSMKTSNAALAAGDSAEPQVELADLYHGLAQANLKRNLLPAAEQAELEALKLRSAFPAALVGLGDIALLRGNSPVAAQQYDAALKLDANLVDAYIGLGRAQGAQGNWATALAHFNDAARIKPKSPEAHLWIGEALVRPPNSNPQAAIDQYVQALALRENRYPEAYFGLAQAQIAANRPDLAGENLALALQLKPNYPEALLLQGKLNEQLGNDSAALDSYTRSIKAGGQLAEPYYRRALLYMRTDQLDSAASDLGSALKIQENFSEAHYWLGRVYLAQSKFKQARDELVLAVKYRANSFADAYFYRGLAEEQLGLREDAVQSYQTALEQDGNAAWVGEARGAVARLSQP